MNCCWLILLLLFSGGNNGRNGCGCEEPARPNPPCARPEPPCGRQEPEPCPCEDSRFEPRFEQRPFSGNGSTCGCEGECN
ncbi:MAG: hypothetical protein K2M20_00170 [Lachnospiraceae bacterium]|nr:hypothetical protein [Lachnospiraceae bacterium]MDE6604337.1 hypothetical protein [Lachnospiraceae bacterium]